MLPAYIRITMKGDVLSGPLQVDGEAGLWEIQEFSHQIEGALGGQGLFSKWNVKHHVIRVGMEIGSFLPKLYMLKTDNDDTIDKIELFWLQYSEKAGTYHFYFKHTLYPVKIMALRVYMPNGKDPEKERCTHRISIDFRYRWIEHLSTNGHLQTKAEWEHFFNDAFLEDIPKEFLTGPCLSDEAVAWEDSEQSKTTEKQELMISLVIVLFETPEIEESRNDRCILVSSGDHKKFEASLENGSPQLARIGNNQLRVLFEKVEPDKTYSCYIDIGDACAGKGSMQCLFYNRKITREDAYTGSTDCFGNTAASSSSGSDTSTGSHATTRGFPDDFSTGFSLGTPCEGAVEAAVNGSFSTASLLGASASAAKAGGVSFDAAGTHTLEAKVKSGLDLNLSGAVDAKAAAAKKHPEKISTSFSIKGGF